ncbi:MAG: M23 family metallopeptidase [Lacisediminihabitans sp.]
MLLPPPIRPTRLAGLAMLLTLVVLAVLVVSPASAAARLSAAQPAAGAAPSWSWPIDPPRVIVRPFIAPETPYSAGHRGIDLAAAAGTTIYAPADGVIHFSGVVVDRPVLSIQHAGSLISSFEPVQSLLAEGTTVRRGDPVGTVAPGHCASGCLHFGVRLHGEYVSPLNYLGGIPRSVLLPTRSLR